MAQKTSSQSSRTQALPQPNCPWWIVPAVVGGCLVAVVFAYLHVRIGTSTPPRAAGTALISIGIFLVTYFIFRRYNVGHNSSSFMGLVISTLVAVPVFALAFIGLGREITEMADFAAL